MNQPFTPRDHAPRRRIPPPPTCDPLTDILVSRRSRRALRLAWRVIRHDLGWRAPAAMGAVWFFFVTIFILQGLSR